MICVWEGLNTAVVRHSHCRHPPLLCPFNDALDLRDAVHITHLRMAVELHPLFQAGVHTLTGKVLALFDTYDGSQGQLAVKFVNGGNALDLDEHSHINGCLDLVKDLRADEHFHCDGVCKVCHVKGQDEFSAAQLPVFTGKDLAPQSHLADLSVDLFDLDEIILKITAIKHIWIVGALDGIFPVFSKTIIPVLSPALSSFARLRLSYLRLLASAEDLTGGLGILGTSRRSARTISKGGCIGCRRIRRA